jgi:uncharacterized protein (DUF1800 family)
MALNETGAVLALQRFGLGACGGADTLRKAASDPRGFLLAELSMGAPLLADTNLQPSSEIIARVRAFQRVQREQRASALPTGAPAALPVGFDRNVIQDAFRADAMARLRIGCAADCGFVERLVWFWSNHFCVSARKGQLVRATAGALEREAIRPHVLGRFRDMLQAVEQHPAMLVFLDNTISVGPRSRAGERRGRGLNENLAREILELHTLGVDGGYTQEDVAALARMITGWTIGDPEGRLGQTGAFVFNPNTHEPGGQQLLGKTYADDGVRQGQAALHDLARHPATARFIATKLSRHFVADAPPPELVDRLARVYIETDGDLRLVAAELVSADQAWTAAVSKLRTPAEFTLATARLINVLPPRPQPLLNMMAQMGQPLWDPAGPNGFPDLSSAWASPNGMKARLDASTRIARATVAESPMTLLDEAFGAAASAPTRQAVARAESREQALALVLMSPEFQRR